MLHNSGRVGDCLAQLIQKRRNDRVGIVRLASRRECFDRQIALITRFAYDSEKLNKVRRSLTLLAKRTLFDLPVYGVGSEQSDIGVGILRPEISRIDDGATPLRTHRLDERQKVRARLEEITVVLYTDSNFVLLRMVGALP